MSDVGLKPARKGMALAHPSGGVLPDEGGRWPNDQFTMRRLRDHDVKLFDPEPDAPAPRALQPSTAGTKDKE